MTKSGKHCGKRRNCTFWAIFSSIFEKNESYCHDPGGGGCVVVKVFCSAHFFFPVFSLSVEHLCRMRCSCFFFHYVFKKPSAAEVPESVYMRERVNRDFPNFKSFSADLFIIWGKWLIYWINFISLVESTFDTSAKKIVLLVYSV